MQAKENADSTAFTFGMWQIRSCLPWVFLSAEWTVINWFAILQVFMVGLQNWSEFFGCFIEASKEIWRKVKYFLRWTRACHNLQHFYVNVMGKNPTIVKLPVESINLRLCDSNDYCTLLIFHSYTVAKTKLNFDF